MSFPLHGEAEGLLHTGAGDPAGTAHAFAGCRELSGAGEGA